MHFDPSSSVTQTTSHSNPRHQFIFDLQSWIKCKIESGHDIILALDANATYNPDTPGSPHPLQYKEGIPTYDKKHDAKLSTLISTCNLVDPLAKQHSSRPFPASHIRGSERIDFILVSQTIDMAVKASGCLSFSSLFNSDHKNYCVDFDAKLLFSDPAYEIAPRSYRKVRLHDPKLIDKYRELLYHLLDVHKILEKLTDLKGHV
jgi:exonuclease III